MILLFELDITIYGHKFVNVIWDEFKVVCTWRSNSTIIEFCVD